VDHNGQAVGVMGVLHHQPLEAVQVIEATLQIFAARAGAEIERKRFEKDLAEEKERLAVTLRSIGDGFITTDNAGRVLMLNNVAERLTGWSQESAAGRLLPEILCLRQERSRRPLGDALLSIVAEGSGEALAGTAIIIARDGTAICALVTCALEPRGYEVAEAYDSLTAIRLYEEAFKAGRRFDVVISDLTIPGSMSGVEALKRLREIDPEVRAIVSSGYAMDPIMADFRKHGFCGMIAKPYEIDTLGRAVAAAMMGPGPGEENVIHLDFADRKSGAA